MDSRPPRPPNGSPGGGPTPPPRRLPPPAALVPAGGGRREAGDRVPADGTLVDAHGAMLDESILTGESVPVDKTDRDEAFSGTLLVRGKAYLDVTRTGASSAMGRLATLLG